MTGRPDALSPAAICGQRATLVDFLALYIAYVNARHAGNVDPVELVRLRGEMMGRLGAADAAMKALGQRPAGLHIASGLRPQGLAEIVTLNEQLVAVGNDDEAATVIDTLTIVLGRSEAMEEEARRSRRNPLWWIDRVLRAVLGLPTYLIGLALRVPAERIDASLPLRLISTAADIAGVATVGYLLGHYERWW
jgi:hypothetical protein